ncbi:hypothetical protein [Roseiarcus sp.]|uniref:hypothetical protein n=1 Tax=Roseiarcus sp. TaxID=1969460 RepID=UPI003F98DB6E
MTLAPLLRASPSIQIHATLAFAALAVGVAGVALFIHTIRTWGSWSPIHLLSLFTLAAVPLAALAARRGDVGRHRSAMIWLYRLALVVAGPSGPGGSCTPSCSGRESSLARRRPPSSFAGRGDFLQRGVTLP